MFNQSERNALTVQIQEDKFGLVAKDEIANYMNGCPSVLCLGRWLLNLIALTVYSQKRNANMKS